MSEAPAVLAEGLVHVYGARRVLAGVDWRVEGAGVFGFLGVNGAGKTTTLRILAGALRPTGGQVRVLGLAPDDRALVGRVSFLPQSPEHYPWMSVQEHLILLGELRGWSRREARAEAGRLLERVDLASAAGKRAGTLSGGMRQRLGLAAALLGRPSLVLLDEPLASLDPVGRREVIDLLAEVGREVTVLFSTHILPDVERVCDRVAVLHEGRIQAWDTPERLVQAAGPPALELELTEDPAPLLAALEGAPWVLRAERGAAGLLRLELRDEPAAWREVPAVVARLGLGLRALRPSRPDLERAFLGIIGEKP